jgi:multidrug efflux pump subunit AcrB
MTAGSLLTPVGVAFDKGVFGSIGNSPNPPENIVVTTNPKFSGFSIAEAYQPLAQLYNIHLKVQALEVGVALAIQFRHAIKPFVVLAAAPYGVVGALIALYLMGGAIVSHVIVLFDFIEGMAEKGEPLEQALLDAGIVRLGPALITVGATVLALFLLAVHRGPLWQPLWYAQIGGLGVATFITLLLVPVLYSILVFDLRIVKWAGPTESGDSAPAGTSASKGEHS